MTRTPIGCGDVARCRRTTTVTSRQRMHSPWRPDVPSHDAPRQRDPLRRHSAAMSTPTCRPPCVQWFKHMQRIPQSVVMGGGGGACGCGCDEPHPHSLQSHLEATQRQGNRPRDGKLHGFLAVIATHLFIHLHPYIYPVHASTHAQRCKREGTARSDTSVHCTSRHTHGRVHAGNASLRSAVSVAGEVWACPTALLQVTPAHSCCSHAPVSR